MLRSNSIVKCLSCGRIIKRLAGLIDGRHSLQGDHDACRLRCGRRFAADLFAELSVLFGRRAHERDCRIVLIELSVLKLIRNRPDRRKSDHVVADFTHSQPDT